MSRRKKRQDFKNKAEMSRLMIMNQQHCRVSLDNMSFVEQLKLYIQV